VSKLDVLTVNAQVAWPHVRHSQGRRRSAAGKVTAGLRKYEHPIASFMTLRPVMLGGRPPIFGQRQKPQAQSGGRVLGEGAASLLPTS